MNKKPFRAVDGPMLMLIAFAFMLVAQVVVSIILVPFMLANSGVEEIISYIGMILFQGTYLLVYYLYTKKRNIVSTFSPRNKITYWSVLAAILVAVICFFCFIGLAYLFEILLANCGYSSPGLEINSPASIVLIAFATVIAAPICEETVFRSAFLSGVTKVRRDEVGTAFLCGICFALMHMNPSQTVYQFLLGSTAAYVTIKCRNVIPAMIIHGLSNAMALVMSFTEIGLKIDAFYMRVGSDIWVMLLLCLAAPVVACVAIWLICRYLQKAEQKKLPGKYQLPPKVIWIDENTKEPIYEGGEVPTITEENRIVQRGFNSLTGEPVLVDRLNLQTALMDDYLKNNGEKSGALGKKSYEIAFGIYFGVTGLFWLITLLMSFTNLI